MKISDNWWTSPTESESGKTIMVTGRDNLNEIIASGKYTDRIEITYPYNGDASGMPTTEEAETLEKIDTALRDTFNRDKACLLTGIYTGDGERNWVVYTKNPRIFNILLNKALESFPLLPLRLYAEKDPDWNEYREMRDASYIAPGD